MIGDTRAITAKLLFAKMYNCSGGMYENYVEFYILRDKKGTSYFSNSNCALSEAKVGDVVRIEAQDWGERIYNGRKQNKITIVKVYNIYKKGVYYGQKK